MKIRNFVLFSGDLMAMYLSLILALLVRGGWDFLLENVNYHFLFFTPLFVIWLLVLYINDFYSRSRLRVDQHFIKSLFNAVLANAGLAIAFFYLIGSNIGITPKTNLILVVLFFSVIFIGWRRFVSSTLVSDRSRKSVLFLEPDQLSQTLIGQLAADSVVPYKTEGVISVSGQKIILTDGAVMHSEIDEVAQLANELKVETVVVGSTVFGDLHRHLYGLTLNGLTVIDAPSFWEELNREIPIFMIDTVWLINNFGDMQKRGFEVVKRIRDFFGAVILSLLFIFPMLVIALVIKISMSGPALFYQTRVGKGGREFTLIKFRTMNQDAEKNGPQWSVKNDSRVTGLGKFLRHTHLDELPQLWNIIKGEMSFIGPRPERPVFVNQLSTDIPYYSLRHLVRPGVSGWAQINYRYGASVSDSAQKLSYDLYYIKHRSHLLDIKIALKTLSTVFRGEGR